MHTTDAYRQSTGTGDGPPPTGAYTVLGTAMMPRKGTPGPQQTPPGCPVLPVPNNGPAEQGHQEWDKGWKEEKI